MSILGILGVIAVVVAFLSREIHQRRERKKEEDTFAEIVEVLADTNEHVQHLIETIYIMESLLIEKGVLSEDETEEAHDRLIELPRRIENEREALTDSGLGTPSNLIIDENIEIEH